MPSPPATTEPRAARLCIVSPHLDDAVLSAFTTLTDTAVPMREVVTVLTRGVPGQVTRWSTLTGFADTAVEHDARREEDGAALGLLDAAGIHLGGIAGDAASLGAAVDAFVQARSGWLRKARVLLPAGAGRRAPLPERAWRRLRRNPDPTGPHPEHLQVRDAFERALRGAGIEWDYYAELPYCLHETPDACKARLERRAGTRLRAVRSIPDAAGKLRAASCYASQAPFALGATPADRLAFCGHAEFLFIRQPASR